MDRRQKRFRIALSFPGEHRGFVSQVAEQLASRVGQDRVLYDQYYEAEFARVDLDTYLQRLYHDESDLIAVFLCADYERKEWCGLEWRAIRDVIKQRRTADVMPLRFDNTDIPGLFSIDGYVWIGDRTPEQIAELILQRIPAPPPTDSRLNPDIAPSRLRHGAARLFGRDDELAELDAAWNNPATNVLSIVAWGGVGKTSLVATWAARLAARGYDGARYFDWSFYSQGTRDQTSASSDAFIAKALEFFGDAQLAESPTSPWDKGARLAQLVAQQRTLLVLDGLEPMQYPPGPLAGELRDPALAALLRGLAQRNPGLCVVTTREQMADLVSFRDTTAPEWKLEHIPVPAGAKLLRSLGVHGTQAEIEQLVRDVKGHALTLNLLGGFLTRAYGGDVRKRDLVQFEEADTKIQGGHAFKAIAAYEKWLSPPKRRRWFGWPFGRRLGKEESERARQIAILRLLGLFDRPADAGCLAALRRPPAIAGLTEPLVELGEDDWHVAVASLADCGLVLWEGTDSPTAALEPAALDTHPLIREYFASQLRRYNVKAWRTGHSRLFDYLKDSAEPTPDTLAGLQPLYQAVAHGCQARRHQEACDEVYYSRIGRGSEFYSTRQLGAYGADLGAVACFFDQPWNRISRLLRNSDQSWLLHQTAHRLRAVGRLKEALEPVRAALRQDVKEEKWRNAAVSASTLSEIELTLGEIAAAIADVEMSLTCAERSEDLFNRVIRRAALAHTLHQAGRRNEALGLFGNAEALQREADPAYPLLYSFAGVLYCDLLLTDAERAAWLTIIYSSENASHMINRTGSGSPIEASIGVTERATKTLGWTESQPFLLDIALDHLTLGRAAMFKAWLQVAGSAAPKAMNQTIRNHIDSAVDGLRRAGTIDQLPRGLLTRTWIRAVDGEIDPARTDLDEAWQIAERGPMRLYMADIHLYRARLFHAVDPYPWGSAREDLAAARKLIEQCGYWRRKEELEDAEAAAEAW